MNYAIICCVASGLLLASLIVVHAQEGEPVEADSIGQRLLSQEQHERERALEMVGRQYVETRRELTLTLEEAARNHRDDRRYMSPLHCAILAANSLRVYEAEDTLLLIVSYNLDVRSFPVGINVGGDYFYPAAAALVSLRVDINKVIDAIVVQAEDDRKVQLLAWVLAERARSIEEAKRILEAQGPNSNIQKAIGLLDRAEHVADLLQFVK